MKLVLHIGTHKTATSTLQRFFSLNKENLLEKKILYGHRDGSKNANMAAKFTAFGRHKDLERFLNGLVEKALKKDTDTILLSGESFYAMNMFFMKMHRKEVTDYWGSEKVMVSNLHKSVPAGIKTKIVCYFRRQDRFLESMYNQSVKSAVSYSGNIEQFYEYTQESLEYAKHMDIWADIFGVENIILRNFEKASINICEDFLSNVLGLSDTTAFIMKNIRINESLNRDVLEFKRILNRLQLPFVDRYMNKQAVKLISATMPDRNEYNQYLSEQSRSAILGSCKAENDRLISIYKINGIPEFDPAIERDRLTYRGLSVEKVIEILARLEEVRNQPSFMIEKLARNVAWFIRKKTRLFSWIVPAVRKLGMLKFLEQLRTRTY